MEEGAVKHSFGLIMVGLLASALVATATPQNKSANDALPWAYGADGQPNPTNPTYPDKTPRHAARTARWHFTDAQVHDRFGPADWHPGDHGPMPAVVSHGRKPDVWSCALCHLPNGKGRPENAGIAGLPYDYFVEQMNDFKTGVRNSAEPRKDNTKRMMGFAKGMTEAEIRAAAAYFSATPWSPWIHVVESPTAPKTRIIGGLFLKLDGNQTEPLGNRIIEVPENTEAAEGLRDDHSGFTAYVPVGSVKKGELLVTTGGNGKTIACGICHGATLTGTGPVPPIAGRSPSYIARQLYDMQHSARYGSWSALMTNAVVNLTPEDIVNISAYVASRPVPAQADLHH